MNRSSRVAAALILALSLAPAAFADEAAIRKNIGERVPQFPKIDEITKSPIPGIYELRIGTDLYYSDEQGNYAFGQSHRIRGTPGLVFEDGRSQAGAMSTEQIEKQLAATRVKTPG